MSGWFKGVRGLIARQGTGSEPQESQPDTPALSTQDGKQLAAVKQRFFEFEQLQSDADKDVAFLSLLRQFCNVFDGVDPRDIVRAFGKDATRSFTFHVSRSVVKDVRARAGNSGSSTEVASKVLADHFSAPQTAGFLSLEALNCLVCGDQDMVEPMVKMALPSTLIKTIYLFYDLPVPSSAEFKVDWERMQGRFTRLVSRLCESNDAALEIIDTDDLHRLYDMVISDIPIRNESWRGCTAEIVFSVVTKALSNKVVTYVHKKGCVARCLAALHKTDKAAVPTVLAMLNTVFVTLINSTRISQVLLDDFRTCHGYHFLSDFLLSLEGVWTSEADARRLSTVVNYIAELSYCGVVDLKPSLQLLSNPYQNKDFVLPVPAGGGLSVRNVLAFHVLHTVFVKATSEGLRSVLLDQVDAVFTRDPANYFITETQHTVAMFIEHLPQLSPPLRLKVFRLLEMIVCKLNFVPFPELASLSIQLASSGRDVSALVMHAVVQFTNYDPKYADIFRSVGVLDSVITRLKKFAESREHPMTLPAETLQEEREDFHLLMQCLGLIIHENHQNCDVLRSSGSVDILIDVAMLPQEGKSALHVIQQLILEETRSSSDDLGSLLQRYQSVPLAHVEVKLNILKTVVKLFSVGPQTKKAFLDVQGYLCVSSTFLSFPNTAEPPSEDLLSVLRLTFTVLSLVVRDSLENQDVVLREDYYALLRESLQSANLLTSQYARATLDCIFSMATDTFGQDLNWDGMQGPPACVVNPHILKVIISALPVESSRVSVTFLKRTRLLCQSEASAQNCCKVEILGEILSHFGQVLLNVGHPLHDDVKAIVTYLGESSISPGELKALLRLSADIGEHIVSPSVVKLLTAMAADLRGSRDADFIEFDMSRTGYASCFAPAIARIGRETSSSATAGSGPTWQWPPPGGMSLSMWIRVMTHGMDEHPIRLATFFSPKPSGEVKHLQLLLDPNDLELVIIGEDGARLKLQEHTFRFNRWTHVCVTFSKLRTKNCGIRLVVDGTMVEEHKGVPLVLASKLETGAGPDLVSLRIGTNQSQSVKSALVWRLGPTILFSDTLSADVAKVIAQLGPSYAGCLQGSLGEHLPYCSSIMPSEVRSQRSLIPLHAAGGRALLPPGHIDLRRLPSPLVPESNLVLALHARTLRLVDVDECCVPLGGRAALRLFRREMSANSGAPSIPSMRNFVRSGTPYANLTSGIRSCVPRSVATVLSRVGGIAVILRIVADASTSDYLRDAVELFTLAVKHCHQNAREAEQVNGYAVLGGLLGCKGELLSREVIDLVISLTWAEPQSRTDRRSVMSSPSSPPPLGRRKSFGKKIASALRKNSETKVGAGHDVVSISNAIAFRELVLTYEVYKSAPEGLVRLVFRHVAVLVGESPLQSDNVTTLRALGIVPTYLAILSESGTPATVAAEIIAILTTIFKLSMVAHDVRQLGHLLMCTLPTTMSYDGSVNSEAFAKDQAIRARHMILAMLANLLHMECTQQASKDGKSLSIAEVLVRTLTPLFFVHFIQPEMDERSVILALQIIVRLAHLDRANFCSKLSSTGGYELLTRELETFVHVPEIYILVCALLLGTTATLAAVPMKELDQASFQEHLDHSYIDEGRRTTRVGGALVVISGILEILQRMIDAERGETQHDEPESAEASAAPGNPFAGDQKQNGNGPPGNPFSSAGSQPAKPGNPFGPPKPGNPFGVAKKPGNPFLSPSGPPPPSSVRPGNPFGGLSRGENPQVSSPASPVRPAPPVELHWSERFHKTLLNYLGFLLSKNSQIHPLVFAAGSSYRLTAMLFAASPAGPDAPRTELSRTVSPTEAAKYVVVDGPNSCRLRRSSGSVERCFRFIAQLCFSYVNLPKDRAFQFLDDLIEHTPRLSASDFIDFISTLAKNMFQYVIDHKLLASPPADKRSVVLPNVGRFLGRLANRLCGCWASATVPDFDQYAVVLKDTLTMLHRILRQVCDEHGAIMQYSLTAWGKGSLQPTIDQLVAVSNKLSLVLMCTAQQCSPYVAIDSVRFTLWFAEFSLGPLNTDSVFVPCMCKIIAGWIGTQEHRESNNEIDKQLAELWRTLIIRRSHQVGPMLKSKVDAVWGRSVTDEQLLIKLHRSKNEILDASTKAWSTFEISEGKSLTAAQQLLAKRVAWIARDDRNHDELCASKNSFERKTYDKRSRCVALERRRQRSRLHTQLDQRRFLRTQYKALELSLYRTLAVFGPTELSPFDKWKLAEREGRNRMRKLLRANPAFYSNYLPLNKEPDALPKGKKKPPTSAHSLPYFEQTLDEKASRLIARVWTVHRPTDIFGSFNPDTGLDEGELVDGDPDDTDALGDDASREPGDERDARGLTVGSQDGATIASSPLPASPPSASGSDRIDDVNKSPTQKMDAESEAKQEDQIVLQILGPQDKRLWEVEAAQSTGLDALDGVFIFCETTAFFAPTYGITKHGKIFRRPQNEQQSDVGEEIVKWSFEDVRDLRRRRYCLQDLALEIFSEDGMNRMLVFNDKTTRDEVYESFLTVANTLVSNAKESVDGMARDATLERRGGLGLGILSGLSGLVGGKNVTQRWEAGEISNFEYLMHLNSLAGRSYNDLNQYPVFPWVLTNYHSEELDLNNPENFRDLSKPMGALDPTRAAHFRERYELWEDPTGEGTPPFHYGTHYSSAQYVAGYLVRLEPFTSQFVRLQGGHFDHADRMFHSIGEAWDSASKLNHGDVKELIPEFYYLPDFLTNHNAFELGDRQDGHPLSDVVLPPWAKGSPHEFVRMHRAALESDIVSKSLHHWVDLIFGYKQRGDDAVNALNVFHHLTYEGAVDIDKIEDPMQRNATISFINNFGQTPTQLFKRPHPPKRIMHSPVKNVVVITRTNGPERLLSSPDAAGMIPGPVGQIATDNKSTPLACAKGCVVYNGTRLLSWNWYGDSLELVPFDSTGGACTMPGFSLVTTNASGGSGVDCSAVYEGLHQGSITCVQTVDAKCICTGGNDGVLRVWSAPHGPKSHGLILQHVLCGHTRRIKCMSVSQRFSLLVSGSSAGECIVWDLIAMSFVRQIELPERSPVVDVAICQHSGNILICSLAALSLVSPNGEMLARGLPRQTRPGEAMCACAISPVPDWTNEQLYVTGQKDGSFMLWAADFYKSDEGLWQRDLVALCKMASVDVNGGFPVSALTFTDDAHRLYVGHESGKVFSWGIPDTTGKVAEHWVRDSATTHCMGCEVKFTFSERRHHCRNCGKLFCQKCSSNEAEIPALNIHKPVRVCADCYDTLMLDRLPPTIDLDNF